MPRSLSAVTTAPTETPDDVDEGVPSRARLLSVLAIVFVACAGLVLAGVFLVSGSSEPEAAAPVTKIAPHDLPVAQAPEVVLTATTDSAGAYVIEVTPATAELLKDSRRLVPRDLTPPERSEFLGGSNG